MGRKEEIMKSIRESPKTASELSTDLNLDIQDIRTYIQRLKTDGKIKEIDKDGREFVYDTTDKKEKPVNSKKYLEAIKFFNDFYKENIDYLLENEDIMNFILNNEKMFEKIEVLLTE